MRILRENTPTEWRGLFPLLPYNLQVLYCPQWSWHFTQSSPSLSERTTGICIENTQIACRTSVRGTEFPRLYCCWWLRRASGPCVAGTSLYRRCLELFWLFLFISLFPTSPFKLYPLACKWVLPCSSEWVSGGNPAFFPSEVDLSCQAASLRMKQWKQVRKAEPSPRLEPTPGPPVAPGAAVSWDRRLGQEGVGPAKVLALFSQILFCGFGKGVSFLEGLRFSAWVMWFLPSFWGLVPGLWNSPFYCPPRALSPMLSYP